MTALLLLGAIAAAILLQLGAGVGLGLWRLRSTQDGALSSGGETSALISKAAWAGWRDFRITRRRYEDASHSQCSFFLSPSDGEPLPSFEPGQFITVAMDDPASGSGPPRRLVRCYSLSDAPNDSLYRITVKRCVAPRDRPNLPPGAASSQLHDIFREGDLLQVKAPSGQFLLDADAATPAVFIAGGIGVTPFISMLRWSLAHQPTRAVHLFYGVRNSAEQAFKLVLEDWARAHPSFKLIVLYADPGPDDLKGRDFQEQGFIDIGLLQRLLPIGRRQFYVCGPPVMMATLVPALGVWGVAAADIHFEAFEPASIVATPNAAQQTAIEVQFLTAGRTVIWTGEDANLLDFAEKHGLPVDSGCRTGNCGSCETGLISGEVRYLRKPDFEPAAGRCLLCVAVPVSALVLGA